MTPCAARSIIRLRELANRRYLPSWRIPVLLSQTHEGIERIKSIVIGLKEFLPRRLFRLRQADLNVMIGEHAAAGLNPGQISLRGGQGTVSRGRGDVQ